MFSKRLSQLFALIGLMLTLASGHAAFAHSGTLTPASETTVMAARPTSGVSVIEFYDVKLRQKVKIADNKVIKSG